MINIFEHYASGEKLYGKLVSPICDTFGLTYMEFTVLMFLANNPQYDTATEIVKYRHLTKSHVSMSIRRMLEKNLMLGEYQGQNRRTIHLSLTKEAAPIIEAGRKVQAHFRNILFSGFSEDEITMLSQFIQRVDDNMRSFQRNLETGEVQNG